MGIFDTVTGLTRGVGEVFDQFDDGFQRINPKVTTDDEEESDDDDNESSDGSNAVVGLFDSLRFFNRQFGKIVDTVGDTLTDRRDNVEDAASNLDSRVT